MQRGFKEMMHVSDDGVISEPCATPKIWRHAPACTWLVCLPASASGTLEFTCGRKKRSCYCSSSLKRNKVKVSKFSPRSHGMSYPIAGNVKTHMAKGYGVEHPLVVSCEGQNHI